MSKLNHSTSEGIRIARVLCILLLVYAHAQPYMAGVPDSLFSVAGVVYFLRLFLGHSSVPLLSLISGYLLAKTMDERGYTKELRNKFLTLIVPLVLWNLIYILKEYFKFGVSAVPAVTTWHNAVLAISAPPAMVPLYFLRDAFVCFLLSPLLIGAARKLPVLACLLLLLNGILNADGPLFINSAIPLFYFVGCLLRVRGISILTACIPLLATLVAMLVMLLLSLAPIYAPVDWGLASVDSVPGATADIALRAAGCLVFWAITCRLLNSSMGGVVARYESLAFFMFCAHGMAAGIWWMALSHFGFALMPPVRLIYFLVSPALVLVTSVALAAGADLVAPRIFKRLLGGRAPTLLQLEQMLCLGSLNRYSATCKVENK